MALSNEDEAEIKCLYLANELTLEEIGARYSMSAPAICKLANRRGWPKRSELSGAPRRQRVVILNAMDQVMMRMCGAMSAKLDQMEKAMQAGELGSEDFERDSKAIAAMAAVTQKALATGPDGKKEPKPKSAEPAPISDEAERLHREIVERFERIQRSRELEARPK